MIFKPFILLPYLKYYGRYIMKILIKCSSEPVMGSSYSRVLQHLETNNVAMITAFRTTTCRTAKANKVANADLSADLQRLGYGFTRVDGYYDENCGRDGSVADKERSYYVICPRGISYENFEDSLIALAMKYQQQSVLVWSMDKQKATLWGTEDYEDYDLWETFSSFNTDQSEAIAWTAFKGHELSFSNKVIESCTDLTETIKYPSELRASAYHRKNLLEQYG